MLVGHCPFKGDTRAQTQRNIVENNVRMEDLKHLSVEVRDLIRLMLDPCPEKRPTAQEVKETTNVFVSLTNVDLDACVDNDASVKQSVNTGSEK